jgi:peptidoglycan-N-acetylglucosamine deacetylase
VRKLYCSKRRRLRVCFVIMVLFLAAVTVRPVHNRVKADGEKDRNTVLSSLYMDGDTKDVALKEAYLTFDDGPSYGVTNKILDVLKQEEVKATFFVVGKEIKEKKDIIKRIHREGHSIGLHTYTHNFKKIYKSEEVFIDEMKKTAFMVEELVGISPTAIRFPGGSDRMLNSEFLIKLHDNGFKVYDWNVNIEDGIDPGLSPSRLLKNAKRIKGNRSRVFILAHFNSNNKNTYKALPAIIKYYKDEGYEFKPIDKNTKEYYYRFRKR